MIGNAIEAEGLTRRFGRKLAVSGLSFRVPHGSLFALLGPNGAGKTTAIKLLMNLLEPTRGNVRVLGTDSTRLGPSELAQIGYVSENQRLPGWMTVAELLAYLRPLYPSWNEAFCRNLLGGFSLPLNEKIKNLSRGMKVKAALLSSLAYRPRLLVLDEPFSGLDPLVREELIRGVLEWAGEESWTVLISSQDVDEIERLADWVAFLDAGNLVLSWNMVSTLGLNRLPAGQVKINFTGVNWQRYALTASSNLVNWSTRTTRTRRCVWRRSKRREHP